MTDGRFWTRERLWAAVAALALECGLLVLILTARITPPRVSQDVAQVLLDLPPPPPPPPPIKPREVHPRQAKASGASSPANLRAVATPIVLPKPIVPPLARPTIAVAPVPSTGAAPSSGASDRPGDGTGSGGQGNGTGSGDGGNGDGDGGNAPRQVRGRLKISDLPRDLPDQIDDFMVSVRYVVRIDGRVGDCFVTRSSGYRELDEITCRLIQQRFRFDPSRDRNGRPAETQIDQDHRYSRAYDPREN